jgi:protein tyrosine kinase modulator
MLGHRKFDLDDYVGIVRRRFPVILVPIVIFPILAYVATLVIPPRYKSTSLIFIDRPKVTAEVVRPMSSGDLLERIEAIQENVMSRSLLEPLLTRYGFEAKGQPVNEAAIDKLRKEIAIAPAQFTSGIGDASSGPIPGLSITCTARSAPAAQGICNDVTSMFIEQSVEQQEQLEQGTTDFLSDQLAEAKHKLDEEDAKLADFKARNLGRLPEDQSTNLSVLMEHNAEMDAANQAIDRATQDRSYTQSLLQQQLSAWQSRRPTFNGIVADNVDDLQTQLGKLQVELAEMRTQFTDDYPDVVKLKGEIADLEKRIATRPAKKKPNTNTTKVPVREQETPQIQQLRNQIQQDSEIVRLRTLEQARLKREIGDYEQKLQLSPVVEEQLKNLTRDHETALKFYNDLLSKKSQTGMETALARREDGERFRVLDPPNLPVKPSFPKRIIFLAGGLAGGLAAGVALAVLLEMQDKSIRDERDIEALLKVPNLASVPAVHSLRGWSEQPLARKRTDDKSNVGAVLTLKG